MKVWGGDGDDVLGRTLSDILPSGIPEKGDAERKHEQRKKLASSERTGQWCIGLSKKLADDAHERIKKKETSGRHAVRFFELQANKYQKGEQQDAFQKRLIKLAWVAGRENTGEDFPHRRAVPGGGDDLRNVIQIRINFAGLLNRQRCFVRMIKQFRWKLHRPWNGGNPAIEFAVNKVRYSTEKEPNRRDRHQVVADSGPGDPVTSGTDGAENNEPKNPAMAGHTAVPDPKNAEGILGQHGWSVEEDVTEAAADKDAEQGRVKDKIGNLVFLQWSVSFAGQPFHQVKRADKTGNVRETVPSDAELFVELKEERTEVVNVKGEEHDGEVRTGIQEGPTDLGKWNFIVLPVDSSRGFFWKWQRFIFGGS